MLNEPLLDKAAQFSQLALTCPKDSEIVHIPRIVRAQAAFPYQAVEGLQRRVGEPLRGIAANQNTVFYNAPNKVKDTLVFVKLSHARHNYLWL